MRLKSSILLYALLISCSWIYGQIDAYDYKRELSGITDNWHSVMIPDALFKNVTSDLSDIRIYGITKENDTIEAPYVIQRNKEKTTSTPINFKTINTSITKEGSFITYKIPSDRVINQIQLFFEEDNFDRLIKIEGSHHLKKWYTIADDYRILSIKNELTDYTFTKLKFPDAKYSYFRIFVKGKNPPKITKAQITLKELEEADYKEYTIKAQQIETNKKNKTTHILVDLETAVPVSYIKIEDSNDFDYYRPIRIEYLTDSIKTEKGWKYRYQRLASGTLNSIEENEFRCSNTITNKLRIIISNQDNQPLDIKKIQVKGNVHELQARFTTPANYFLAYGNTAIGKPSYDLQYLSNKIPEKLKNVTIGNEEVIEKNIEVVSPLFKNKMWLWGAMLLVILLLGGFTLTMMKKK